MNREIKFRAWDGKEMHVPEYSDKEDFHLFPDGTVVYTYEVGYERYEQTQRRDDKWVVMQYTGLKDINGKDVYEGDILCWPQYENTKYQTRWVMRWREENAAWSDYSPRDKAEVIGNIYQTPDLLK